MRRLRLAWLAMPLVLLAAACGNDDDSSALVQIPATEAPGGPTETTTAGVTTTAAAAGATTVTPTTAAPTTTGKPGLPCPPTDGSATQTRSFPGLPANCLDASKVYKAVMETNKGKIVIRLDARRAPIAVNSFVYLARYKYFDGLTFHRVIPGFVLQGGDPKGDGSGGPGYEFADELPRNNEYFIGALAMANRGPNTNGSQFFIISGPQGVQLPPNYTLFGGVESGIEVVDTIDKLGDAATEKPKEPVTITKVTIEET